MDFVNGQYVNTDMSKREVKQRCRSPAGRGNLDPADVQESIGSKNSLRAVR